MRSILHARVFSCTSEECIVGAAGLIIDTTTAGKSFVYAFQLKRELCELKYF